MEAQMEPVQHIRILQHAYAAQLADATVQYGRAGILEQVTEARRAARLSTGAATAAKMGVSEPATAFTVSAGLFGCADWSVAPDFRVYSPHEIAQLVDRLCVRES